jgi:hypothetical protein
VASRALLDHGCQVMSQQPLSDALGEAIQAVLESDLREGQQLKRPCDRTGSGDLNGYCAVAAAAYFFLAGGSNRVVQPMQLTHEGRSHWWLERTSDGAVIDLTVRPTESASFPYHLGRRRGFMQHGYKRPSKRALNLMRRVAALSDAPSSKRAGAP